MTQSTNIHAGILYLQGNKTFGRTLNKKRLLYKCIPNDNSYPILFIPYETTKGFSKSYKNKFILFSYNEYERKSNTENIIGEIRETIGDVDILENYYEYQLHCKDLHHSLSEMRTQFIKKDKIYSLSDNSCSQFEQSNSNLIHNNTEEIKIITIDNVSTTTYDDAFSITPTHITIYISNVYYYLQQYELVDILMRTKRVATIYLPNKRIPMLIPQITEKCSLKENTEKIAIAFVYKYKVDEIISSENKKIDLILENIIPYIKIRISKNLSYQDTNISPPKEYINLQNITPQEYNKDSHSVIAYWMNNVKHTITNYFIEHNIQGISHSEKETSIIQEYLIEKEVKNLNREITSQSYFHITSPIRRLPDLLNQILLINKITNKIIDEKILLYSSSTIIIKQDYINNSIKKINKLQLNSYVLSQLYKINLTQTYEGIIMCKNEYKEEYLVYFEKIRLLIMFKQLQKNNIEIVSLKKGSKANFKIYLFEKKETMKKKIKIDIII